MEKDKREIKLLMVRHGETEDNKTRTIAGHRPGKLTPAGIAQASKIGEYLKKEKMVFDQIFVSDLGRTKETYSNALSKYPQLK
jgi:broad specificity phosphatase PhoE